MRRGGGAQRRRFDKPGGKSTRLKRGSSHILSFDIPQIVVPVICKIPRDRKPEISFKQRVDEALNRIHTFGRVERGGGYCQA